MIVLPSFLDRPDAGLKLVEVLKKIPFKASVIIAAIPNGGVPVAIPIAKLAHKFLYVVVARKIQYPWTTEAGFGAITADGTTAFNRAAIQHENLSEAAIQVQVELARAEVQKRAKIFLEFQLPDSLPQAEVILVDDGLASGITTQAAILSLQKRGVQRVIVAVPTAHKSSVNEVEAMSKDNPTFRVQVASPDIKGGWSFAVADAYERWYDEETSSILQALEQYNHQFVTKIHA